MNFSEEFLALSKQVTGFNIPSELESEIREALDDQERRSDMILQLMRLSTFTGRDRPREIKFVDGKFLYVNEYNTYLVWGRQEFQASEGFKIGYVLMIDNRPCWEEYSREQNKVCVVWGGERGQEYPEIEYLQEIDKKPCYRVCLGYALRNPCDKYERNEEFVVWGTQEGTHYEHVYNLVNIENRPCYTARSIGKYTEVFVWGTEALAEGPADYVMGRALPWDNGVVFLVSVAQESDPTRSSCTRLFCASTRGMELIVEADHIGLPGIIDGQLAYHTQNNEGTEVVVTWGEKRFVHAGRMRPWLMLGFRDQSRRQSLLVFGLETPDGKWSLCVNLQCVCKWDRWDWSECTFDPETGMMTLKPERERTHMQFEPQVFNLRELGIIS